MKTDTIAAIATGMSNSGIGIVRISGEEAFSVIDSIFRNRKGERVSLSLAQSHTVHYGYIYDGDEKVDEAGAGRVSYGRTPVSTKVCSCSSVGMAVEHSMCKHT